MDKVKVLVEKNLKPIVILALIGALSAAIIISSLSDTSNSLVNESQQHEPGTIFIVPVSNSRTLSSQSTTDTFINNKLDYRLLRLLENGSNFSEIESISPEVNKSLSVEVNSKKLNLNVKGIIASFYKVEGVTIGEGSEISNNDNQKLSKVAVLGLEAKKNLFGERNAIGENIIIDGNEFKIVGVNESRSGILDNDIYVPLNTLLSERGDENYSQIIVKIKDGSNVQEVAKKIKTIFKEFFSSNESENNQYSIYVSKNLSDLNSNITNAISLLTILAILCFITGVAGGIYLVFKIHLKIENFDGKTNKLMRSIFGLFKSGVFLSALLIGIVGLVLGIAGSFLIGGIANIPIIIPYSFIISVVTLSLVIGLGITFVISYLPKYLRTGNPKFHKSP